MYEWPLPLQAIQRNPLDHTFLEKNVKGVAIETPQPKHRILIKGFQGIAA